MDKNQLLLKLSEDLSAKTIYDDYVESTKHLSSANVRLGIIGQPNTAKTTLINALLEKNFPVSNLPSQCQYYVTYGLEDHESPVSNSKLTNAVINSPWLKENNLSIREMSVDIVPDESTALELCTFLSNCDFCVYLLNAQSALNRTDLTILNNLKDIHMPVILVPSRIDLLSPEDIDDVYSYISSNFVEFPNVKILDIRSSIQKSVSLIKENIELVVKSIDTQIIRKNFENFYYTIAVGKLYEICQAHIDECAEKSGEIEKKAEEKLQQLNEQSTQWLVLESELRRRILQTSDKLRTFLSDRKEDMLRHLSHDVDVCGDIKLFWEKDFPFRLEEMVRAEMGNAAQIINQDIYKSIQWLQDELLKKFHCKISLTSGVITGSGSSSNYTPDGVNIADTHKLKIITRIGTAATVIAAGALFATSGIGGVVMAVSIMSGIGAEFFMKKQSNESKEEIKKHLPEFIDRANLQILTDFETKIQDVTVGLVSDLNSLKKEWLDNSQKSIEQEKSIALFNYNTSKWDAIMININQLGEQILND